METLIGAAIVWFLGNKDLLKLLAAFILSVSVIYIFLTIGGGKYERF